MQGLLLALAISALPVTPQNVSVLGGETREFSARFFDGFGQPVVGESVQFVNDACGVFANGSPVITVRTDTTGLASTTFVARNQGITCWVVASAGVQVRWDVLTFTLPQVHFTASLSPPEPRPGQPFVVNVRPMAGAYRLYEADVIARVIDVTAGASVSPSAANSGQAGSVSFEVTPDRRVGDYEIELSYKGRSQRLAINAPDAPWQDLWWGGSAENGWGVSIVQHGDTLFNVIYAYDEGGRPTWFVMPGGEWNAARTVFTGPLYAPTGASFRNYRADDLIVGPPVGQATLSFQSGDAVVLDYRVGSAAGRKQLQRQNFGLADTPLATRLDDMWWGGPSQNGWGIAVLQQHRSLFAIWFTYDDAGAPTWFVMPAGFWLDASTYAGRIYRANGSAWVGATYDSRAFRTTDVGSFRLRFGAAGSDAPATLDYTIDGRSGTMPLWRQPF